MEALLSDTAYDISVDMVISSLRVDWDSLAHCQFCRIVGRLADSGYDSGDSVS
jgi:hypothetical protein